MVMYRRPYRRRSYWFALRFDILVQEGFSPEESAIISNCRISSGPVRHIRRVRKRMVQTAVNSGMSRRDAIEYVRASVRGTEMEIVSWEDFRRIVYPERQNII